VTHLERRRGLLRSLGAFDLHRVDPSLAWQFEEAHAAVAAAQQELKTPLRRATCTVGEVASGELARATQAVVVRVYIQEKRPLWRRVEARAMHAKQKT
jgi:hypothetical protein